MNLYSWIRFRFSWNYNWYIDIYDKILIKFKIETNFLIPRDENKYTV